MSNYQILCKKYGYIFHQARLKKEFSLRDLSKRTHVSIALISLLESGIKLPRIKTLVSIAEALDIPLLDNLLSIDKICKEDSTNNNNLVDNLMSLNLSNQDVKEVLDYISYIQYKHRKA